MQTALAPRTSAASISRNRTILFEVYSKGKTYYFVTLNSIDQEIVLKSEGDEWKEFNEECELY